MKLLFVLKPNLSQQRFHFNFLQSGERNGTPSRRSKSEGPPLANGRCVNALENVSEDKQIKEKVFSISLIFYAECGMFMFIII